MPEPLTAEQPEWIDGVPVMEFLEFASNLSDDIGPSFGSDAAKLVNALLEQRAALSGRLRDAESWETVARGMLSDIAYCPEEMTHEAIRAIFEPLLSGADLVVSAPDETAKTETTASQSSCSGGGPA